MIRRPGPAARLCGDDRGATIVEFAIVLPIMLVVIMGLSDLAYYAYVRTVLEGAVQKAARDATIQGNDDDTTTLDARVMTSVRPVARNAVPDSKRFNYYNFGAAAPERFTDANGNNSYDAGECFEDINGNRSWDADPGPTGQGGASDVTVYSMTITFPRLFPLAKMLGWSATQAATAKTFLRNQPYATQSERTSTPVTICP